MANNLEDEAAALLAVFSSTVRSTPAPSPVPTRPVCDEDSDDDDDQPFQQQVVGYDDSSSDDGGGVMPDFMQQSSSESSSSESQNNGHLNSAGWKLGADDDDSDDDDDMPENFMTSIQKFENRTGEDILNEQPRHFRPAVTVEEGKKKERLFAQAGGYESLSDSDAEPLANKLKQLSDSSIDEEVKQYTSRRDDKSKHARPGATTPPAKKKQRVGGSTPQLDVESERKYNKCCHLCRTIKEGKIAHCTMQLEAGGFCSKVICKSCLTKYGWDWSECVDNPRWVCCHCENQCRRPQCNHGWAGVMANGKGPTPAAKPHVDKKVVSPEREKELKKAAQAQALKEKEEAEMAAAAEEEEKRRILEMGVPLHFCALCYRREKEDMSTLCRSCLYVPQQQSKQRSRRAKKLVEEARSAGALDKMLQALKDRKCTSKPLDKYPRSLVDLTRRLVDTILSIPYNVCLAEHTITRLVMTLASAEVDDAVRIQAVVQSILEQCDEYAVTCEGLWYRKPQTMEEARMGLDAESAGIVRGLESGAEALDINMWREWADKLDDGASVEVDGAVADGILPESVVEISFFDALVTSRALEFAVVSAILSPLLLTKRLQDGVHFTSEEVLECLSQLLVRCLACDETVCTELMKLLQDICDKVSSVAGAPRDTEVPCDVIHPHALSLITGMISSLKRQPQVANPLKNESLILLDSLLMGRSVDSVNAEGPWKMFENANLEYAKLLICFNWVSRREVSAVDMSEVRACVNVLKPVDNPTVKSKLAIDVDAFKAEISNAEADDMVKARMLLSVEKQLLEKEKEWKLSDIKKPNEEMLDDEEKAAIAGIIDAAVGGSLKRNGDGGNAMDIDQGSAVTPEKVDQLIKQLGVTGFSVDDLWNGLLDSRCAKFGSFKEKVQMCRAEENLAELRSELTISLAELVKKVYSLCNPEAATLERTSLLDAQGSDGNEGKKIKLSASKKAALVSIVRSFTSAVGKFRGQCSPFMTSVFAQQKLMKDEVVPAMVEIKRLALHTVVDVDESEIERISTQCDLEIDSAIRWLGALERKTVDAEKMLLAACVTDEECLKCLHEEKKAVEDLKVSLVSKNIKGENGHIAANGSVNPPLLAVGASA